MLRPRFQRLLELPPQCCAMTLNRSRYSKFEIGCNGMQDSAKQSNSHLTGDDAFYEAKSAQEAWRMSIAHRCQSQQSYYIHTYDWNASVAFDRTIISKVILCRDVNRCRSGEFDGRKQWGDSIEAASRTVEQYLVLLQPKQDFKCLPSLAPSSPCPPVKQFEHNWCRCGRSSAMANGRHDKISVPAAICRRVNKPAPLSPAVLTSSSVGMERAVSIANRKLRQHHESLVLKIMLFAWVSYVKWLRKWFPHAEWIQKCPEVLWGFPSLQRDPRFVLELSATNTLDSKIALR